MSHRVSFVRHHSDEAQRKNVTGGKNMLCFERTKGAPRDNQRQRR